MNIELWVLWLSAVNDWRWLLSSWGCHKSHYRKFSRTSKMSRHSSPNFAYSFICNSKVTIFLQSILTFIWCFHCLAIQFLIWFLFRSTSHAFLIWYLEWVLVSPSWWLPSVFWFVYAFPCMHINFHLRVLAIELQICELTYDFRDCC